MKRTYLLLSTVPLLLAAPAWADDGADPQDTAPKGTAAPAAAPAAKAFTTGVAKGRDLLDTAISASTIDDSEIRKLGAQSLYEVLGNLPGIRVEAPGTDGYTSLSIRGLPLAADGTKFLQIEEDGLPVLEFGDIHFAAVDTFTRADLTLSQVQSIRGGSSSTFASNSPGGVINLLSRTGEEEGGAVQFTTGLNFGQYRGDFTYGGRLDGQTRFNIGGFYRQGEGPRAVGYRDAFRGGQIKLNITREFAGGFVRLYGKFLDDRQPGYGSYYVEVGGTNANPQYRNLPGFDIRTDTLLSRYYSTSVMTDQNNRLFAANLHEGLRGISKAVGMEAQLEVGGWTINEKIRFAANSGHYGENFPAYGMLASDYLAAFGGPGATLRYATGPRAGQIIANPDDMNGNGLVNTTLLIDAKLNSLNNLTNDLRASRVWTVGGGKLTSTAGIYASSQDVDMNWNITTAVTDFVGGANNNLLNLYDGAGNPVFTDGISSYSVGPGDPSYRRHFDVNYKTLAPYGSLNYQIGKLSLGASLRYDHGRAKGQLFGAELGGGRVGITAIDINGDGIVTSAEQSVAILPLLQPGKVDYSYNYVSYSAGANYRLAESLSAFARYSRGGRASADRILFSPLQNPTTGGLNDPKAAYGIVKQAEVGIKFRRPGATIYVTGFWASTNDKNFQISADAQGNTVVLTIDRVYSAKGVEFEGIFRQGPFSLTTGATLTRATIDSDTVNAALAGTRPRHQASFFFSARPQYESHLVTLGASVTGTTSSFAQDGGGLIQPGYVVVNPFVEVRPRDNLQLSLNVNNLFNTIGVIQAGASSIPANGLVAVQTINGRTIMSSLRFSF